MRGGPDSSMKEDTISGELEIVQLQARKTHPEGDILAHTCKYMEARTHMYHQWTQKQQFARLLCVTLMMMANHGGRQRLKL